MKSQTTEIKKTHNTDLELIEDPILDYAVVSRFDVNRLAKSNVALPIATLALVGEKLYPIGGFASIQAAKIRGDKEIECVVKPFETVNDAVRFGIVQCGILEPVDLTQMPDILGFFDEDLDSSINRLNMDGTIMEKIARCRLVPEIYKKVADVQAKLSQRLSAQTLAVDPQFLINIARANPKKQVKVFDTVCQSIDFNGPESHFMWPSPEEIKIVVRTTSFIEEDRIDDDVVVHGKSDDSVVLHIDQDNDDDDGDKPQEERADTMQILKQSKGEIVIPISDNEHIVVDTKAKTLKKLTPTEDKLNFDAVSLPTERAVMMPTSTVKHLDLSRNETNLKHFDSPNEAIEYLGTIQHDAKVAIFWKSSDNE